MTGWLNRHMTETPSADVPDRGNPRDKEIIRELKTDLKSARRTIENLEEELGLARARIKELEAVDKTPVDKTPIVDKTPLVDKTPETVSSTDKKGGRPSKGKPWEAMGMSRSAYYKTQKATS